MELKLTYGFEVEGGFSKTLNTGLGIFKHDGSVHNITTMDKPMACSHSNCSGMCGSFYTEYESPVYKTADGLLKNLERFDNKNYVWNDSCGLHLNIGVDNIDNWRLLLGWCCNYKFLTQIRQEAYKFCPCQVHRLKKDDHFYRFYQNRKDLIMDAYSSEKYRFCRFHEEKRLEFRFMAPCEHKVKNVSRVIELMLNYLNSIKDVKMKIINREEVKSRDIVINLPFNFTEKEEDIEYVRNLSL